MQGHVGGEDDDDGAVLVQLFGFEGFALAGHFCRGFVHELEADGEAADAEIAQLAVVALDEGADGVGGWVPGFGAFVVDETVDLAAGGAGAAFEALAEHAGSATGVAFFDCVAGSVVDSAYDVRRFHNHGTDVVKVQITSLRNHRQQKPIAKTLLIPILADRILVNPRITRSHGERVRNHNRGIQQSRFIQPMTTRHFPGAVEAEIACIAAFVEPVFARENGGDSSVDLFVCVVSREYDRLSVHKHAGDISEGV